jgi:hypothetical protein
MSHRLQVLIPPQLDAQISKAAQRQRISKGEWVRRALELSLQRDGKAKKNDAMDRLSRLNGPTADIERMLSEIESGRS